VLFKKMLLRHSKPWNEMNKRMIFLASRGFSFKDNRIANELSRISNQIAEIYATAKVCDQSECFTPDKLNEIMANSRDSDKLEWIWKGWHEVTGPKLKDLFSQRIELNNRAAQENSYEDLSEFWIEEFETNNFESIVDNLYESIKPLYEQLHAYVRRKLDSFYRLGHKSKLIPEHLLSNMWGQSWENVFDIVQPYKNVPVVNITEKLLEKNYTVEKIFRDAENFFVSLGLPRMTPTFWKKSLFVRPSDLQVQCHASAFDFFNGFDYRIKMCTKINSEDFYVVHHEMGHIEYFMNYAHQPAIFRSGANSAFHEAIGDIISLSVSSQKHLYRKGFVEKEELSYEEMINYLMNMALKKIAFLPFGYLVDKWRWNVFRGNITSDKYNREWWNMKLKYQGVEAPMKRNESYFDPGSKYHVAVDVPYVRYFLSHIYEFEFYEVLCKLSGHKGPLYNCDFFGSKKAGNSLK
jgi:peptidyl-dipeptidase A